MFKMFSVLIVIMTFCGPAIGKDQRPVSPSEILSVSSDTMTVTLEVCVAQGPCRTLVLIPKSEWPHFANGVRTILQTPSTWIEVSLPPIAVRHVLPGIMLPTLMREGFKNSLFYRRMPSRRAFLCAAALFGAGASVNFLVPKMAEAEPLYVLEQIDRMSEGEVLKFGIQPYANFWKKIAHQYHAKQL